MLLETFTSCLLPYAFFALCFSFPQPDINGRRCKAVPNSPSWPSETQRNAFNSTISGHLLAPFPPAAVCDTSLEGFNNVSCAYVASQWSVSDFHSNDPVSVDQPNVQNDACLPSSELHCNLQRFPVYVVNATKAAHVKAAVNFAWLHNVRLIVKGTGHDVLGRSTAPNSLSVWTHNLRGLQHHERFVAKECSADALPAITVAAGSRMFEIYDAAAAHNPMIVGANDPDVGLGGYLTGGGHSPISGQYGLGADNVLEFEVVTPAGGPAGGDGQIGSRLLDEKALSMPLPSLAAELAAAYPSNFLMFSNLVSGPGVWNADPPGGLGGITPAWRTAVVEIIVAVGWPPRNATAKATATALLTHTYMAALRRLAPDTGCYLNEADPDEPDLPPAYWGGNYPRLLAIKRRWDPEGVFWCALCVGGGDWVVEGGRVCRV